MSALICMAVYDTEENGRSKYTKETLMSLRDTVDFKKHRITIIDNNSCAETKVIIKKFGSLINAHLIQLSENVGTAKAINFGLKLRHQSEYCIKMDNDVVVHQSGWVDEMQEAVERDPTIGVLGLKRKDLIQNPNHKDPDFRSTLQMLPHDRGEKWIIVEQSRDIMGTCTMINHRLLDVIGGFVQYGVYGFDDQLISLRSLLSGFWNGFLPHINIDHIDTGDNPYTQEKRELADIAWPEFQKLHNAYTSGELPLKIEL